MSHVLPAVDSIHNVSCNLVLATGCYRLAWNFVDCHFLCVFHWNKFCGLFFNGSLFLLSQIFANRWKISDIHEIRSRENVMPHGIRTSDCQGEGCSLHVLVHLKGELLGAQGHSVYQT